MSNIHNSDNYEEDFEVVKYSLITKKIMSIYQKAMAESNLFYKVSNLLQDMFVHDFKISFTKQDKTIPLNYTINDEGHNHIVFNINGNIGFEFLIKDIYKNLCQYFANDENITINKISDTFFNIYFHKKHCKNKPNDVKEYLYAYELLEKDNSIKTQNKIKNIFKTSIKGLYNKYLITIHDIAISCHEKSILKAQEKLNSIE